jgi:DNA-binding response OmpR family regulator
MNKREIALIMKDWQERAFIRAQLIEEGYEVTGIETTQKAIARLCQGTLEPHLIILDTLGQDLDDKFLADLRALTGNAPIIVCSGPYDLAGFDPQRAKPNRVLVRPFTVRELVEAVETVCEASV